MNSWVVSYIMYKLEKNELFDEIGILTELVVII